MMAHKEMTFARLKKQEDRDFKIVLVVGVLLAGVIGIGLYDIVAGLIKAF